MRPKNQQYFVAFVLQSGVNFINVSRAAFAHVDPKSVKRYWGFDSILMLLLLCSQMLRCSYALVFSLWLCSNFNSNERYYAYAILCLCPHITNNMTIIIIKTLLFHWMKMGHQHYWKICTLRNKLGHISQIFLLSWHFCLLSLLFLRGFWVFIIFTLRRCFILDIFIWW